MEINDSFRVDLPVDEAWRVLLDIERIAPCLPGAQLQEIEGDEFRGAVKVKVGPITAQYKGTAHFEERDDTAHVAVLTATGRDTRGQGNASANIRIALEPDAGGTLVKIDTDLSITGKVAQFGRGVLADVSSKLLGQFVENLERDVLGASEVVDLTDAERGTTASELPISPSPAPSADAGEPSGNGAGVRHIAAREVEPVDLLDIGGTPVLKRLVPAAGAIAILVVLVALVRRRRRRARRRHG